MQGHRTDLMGKNFDKKIIRSVHKYKHLFIDLATEIDWRDAKLEKLAYEIAHLRRMKFSARGEQIDSQRNALFEESVDAGIAAPEAELEALKMPALDSNKKTKPRRAALPENLPDVEIHHEPDSTASTCG